MYEANAQKVIEDENSQLKSLREQYKMEAY